MALRSLEATMKENAAKHGMPPWLLRAVEPSFGAAETGAGDRGERLGRVKLSVGYEGDMGLTVRASPLRLCSAPPQGWYKVGTLTHASPR